MNDYTILHGDALAMLRTLPTGSVHCCVTSPPYYGLRSYLPNGHPDKTLEIGLDKTVDAYVARLVAVFEEVRRVLRDDGTLFLNIGDSYCTRSVQRADGMRTVIKNYAGEADLPAWREYAKSGNARYSSSQKGLGLKDKDLMMIPARVALALQDAGWYLRADIIWAKKAPMPESVTDRPTRSHEHIFLLTKRERYYYDAEAVKEPYAQASIDRADDSVVTTSNPDRQVGFKRHLNDGGRNQRDVWLLGPSAYSESHFATFVPEIPRRAILAGTSERGCCPVCGSPWKRVVERTTAKANNRAQSFGRSGPVAKHVIPGQSSAQHREGRDDGVSVFATTGWRPTCTCPGLDGDAPWPDVAMHPDGEANWPAIPCTVLDPFGGSGTTAAVAVGLGRRAILIELNASYIELAHERVARAQRPLFGIL